MSSASAWRLTGDSPVSSPSSWRCQVRTQGHQQGSSAQQLLSQTLSTCPSTRNSVGERERGLEVDFGRTNHVKTKKQFSNIYIVL